MVDDLLLKASATLFVLVLAHVARPLFRLKCWRAKRRAMNATRQLARQVESPPTWRPRRCLAIVNPISGAGQGVLEMASIWTVFRHWGVKREMRVTEYAGHAREMVSDVSKYDLLVVAGGDGFLHEVLNALPRRAPHKTRIAVVPAGTGNGVATSLGIRSAVELGVAISRGATCRLDLLSVQTSAPRAPLTDDASPPTPTTSAALTVRAALSVGWGAIADHDRLAERSLRWMGLLRLLAVPAWIIAQRVRYSGRVCFKACAGEPPPTRAHTTRADGWTVLEASFALVHICNLPWIASDVLAAPGAATADGRFGVLLIRGDVSRLQLVRFFLASQSGAHLSHEACELYWATEATIEPAPHPVGCIAVDGELVSCYPALTRITSLPGAVEVVCAQSANVR